MILGVDPKNDYAFKCVFGSEKRTGILIHLLNAVLKPSPGHRVESVQIQNPFTEKTVLDEKLSILDIKARDQSGRYFNIEMQMVVHPSVRGRFLYYWAKVFGGQLISGENYATLQPAISIIFLDGILFPQSNHYHLPFALLNQETQIAFSDHLAIHVFQLPNFTKSAQELSDPLEKWLYFLNNGFELDPEAVPAALQDPEIQQAVRTLEMLTQDQLERERYEAREKARRDAVSWHKALEGSMQVAEHARQEAEHARQEAERWKKAVEDLQQQVATLREKGISQGLLSQIRLLEDMLKRTSIPEEQLLAKPVEELRRFAEELRHQLQVNGAK